MMSMKLDIYEEAKIFHKFVSELIFWKLSQSVIYL